MFKQRLLTGLLLAAVAIGGILGLPTPWFGAVLLGVILLAAWEWAALIETRSAERLLFCAAVTVLVVAAWQARDSQAFVLGAMVLACGFWCYALAWLRRYSQTPSGMDSIKTWRLAGYVALVMPWLALTVLHGRPGFGSHWVLFLMALIWIADSGAYFAGRRWGRRKLAPHISPGKTWEGVAGALGATLVFAALGATSFNLGGAHWLLFVLVCMVTVLFSVVGDLFESMLKRQRGVKDSGRLLPGHGGLLDRLDSLTAAAPVFMLGIQGLGR